MFDALVDAVTARTGRLDVMVCNAGGSGDLPSTYVPNSSVEEFMHTIDLNLKGAYLCAPGRRARDGEAALRAR